MPFITPATVSNLPGYLAEDRARSQQRSKEQQTESDREKKILTTEAAYSLYQLSRSAKSQEEFKSGMAQIVNKYDKNPEILETAMSISEGFYNQQRQQTADTRATTLFEQKQSDQARESESQKAAGQLLDDKTLAPEVRQPLRNLMTFKDKLAFDKATAPKKTKSRTLYKKTGESTTVTTPKEYNDAINQGFGKVKYPTVSKQKEMTPDQANKEYVRVQGQIDKVKNSGGLDELLLASMSPEIRKALMGADRSEYLNTLNAYSEELKKKITIKTTPVKPTGSAVTHKWENGKLIKVEVE